MFVAELFSVTGYAITFGKPRLAYGYHIAALRGAERILICTARRLAPVGSELVASIGLTRREYPEANRFIAITSGTFNPTARSLAKQLGVELWDRVVLEVRMTDLSLSI